MPEFGNDYAVDQETDQFIKAPPSWLIKYGMILMIIIFVALILGAYFMPYPDTIESKGYIKMDQVSVRIYAPKLKKPSYIVVRNGMAVKKNEIVAIITRNPSNGLMLSVWRIINAIDTAKQIRVLLSDVNFSRSLEAAQRSENFNLWIKKTKHLKERSNEGLHEWSDQSLREELSLLAKGFRKAVDDWKDTNTLMSPIDGKVIFARPDLTTENSKAGEELFNIQSNTQTYHIQANIPPSIASRIKKGQKCYIKVDEYPYQTYGILVGEVSTMSNLNSDSNYIVNLFTNEKLITTKDFQIPVKAKYFINTSIVIRNRSLLDRLISRHID